MFKNVATKIALFAFDVTTGAAKTGDAANLTAYVAKDYGTLTVLADTSATEVDATNGKGWYLFDVAQAETNGDALLFTAKSSTSNVAIVGQYIFTTVAPWSVVLEGGYTASDLLRIVAAVQSGKTSITDLGGGAATVVFRNVGDTADIVTATMAGSERSAVTRAP